MKSIGIKVIYVIQHKKEIEKVCGYDYYGVKIKYIEQEKQDGLAKAVMLCKHLKEDMCIILGDIIYVQKNDDLLEAKRNFEYALEQGEDVNSAVTFKYCNEYDEIAKSYGINIKGDIIEKPKYSQALKNLLGLGIYFTTPEIFPFLENENEFMNVFNSMECLSLRLNGKYHNINTEEDFANANHNTIQDTDSE